MFWGCKFYKFGSSRNMWQSLLIIDQATLEIRQQKKKGRKEEENINNKPVGDWISAPSPNFVAMATRVGPQNFAWFH